MVTMVYPRFGPGLTPDERIANVFRVWMAEGKLFTGSASFLYWTTAAAYALLPADPSITTAPGGRRQITRTSSGRWSVTQTFRPRVMPVFVQVCSCSTSDPGACPVHASGVPMVVWADDGPEHDGPEPYVWPRPTPAGCVNPWHDSAPARRALWCPECPGDPLSVC